MEHNTDTPTLSYVCDLLGQQLWSGVFAGLPISWRYPPTTPEDPLQVTPNPSWPAVDALKLDGLQKNTRCWFYSEVTIPECKANIPTAGTHARIFIMGNCPFTLWVDGVELFKEEHAWHATGPIYAELPEPLRPGQTLRFIACLEPTELPSFGHLLNVYLLLTACWEMEIQLSAVLTQLRIAEALAENAEEKALVEQAAACLDLDAVRTQRWDAVLASASRMEETLLPLSPKAKARTLHFIGHTHIDMDWMWTWKDTVYCIRRDFKSAVDILRDYPEITFNHSQIPTYQVAEAMDPDIFARVKEYIHAGRWENVAATWVEGDLNMADGESIARQLLYAADWSAAHLGATSRVLWEPDTFGHPGNMPQLAKLAELDGYFHWRGNPGRDDNWPYRLWEGIDGSTVLAVSSCYGGDIRPDTVMHNTLLAEKHGFRNAFAFWGFGDHGGGLPRYTYQSLSLFRDKPLIPTIKFSTMPQLMDAVRGEQDKLPSNKGETYSLFEGCFTTHASIKMYNRRCEGMLLTAEAVCALAGLQRSAKLRDAWTPILFSQFHDIFDGAAVHDSYRDAHARAEKTLATVAEVSMEALQMLLDTSETGSTLVLVNTLGFTRSEPVYLNLPATVTALRDAEGTIIPVQHQDGQAVFIAEGIPAFSQKCYTLLEEAVNFPGATITEWGDFFSIDTPGATSQLNKLSGAIGSYYDKRLAREFIAYGVPKTLTHIPNTRLDLAMNVFQVLDEAPNAMSAWLVNDILREEYLLRGAEVTLLENGPVCARFRVKHTFRASHIEEDIIFYQHFPRVDFTIRVDWHEQGSPEAGVPALRISFASGLSAARARSEGPFCISERPADGTDYPTQKWLDVSGDGAGFTLLNDCKYGYDVLGGRARMSLLRNPYAPDAETDNGTHTIRLAFVPHGAEISNAELSRAGMAFNRAPLTARTQGPVALHPPSLVMEGAESVICTALRLAEHSNRLLLRFFETGGSPCTLTFTYGQGISSAEVVNLLEHPTGETPLVHEGKVTTTFHPYEVKTLLLESR